MLYCPRIKYEKVQYRKICCTACMYAHIFRSKNHKNNGSVLPLFIFNKHKLFRYININYCKFIPDIKCHQAKKCVITFVSLKNKDFFCYLLIRL